MKSSSTNENTLAAIRLTLCLLRISAKWIYFFTELKSSTMEPSSLVFSFLRFILASLKSPCFSLYFSLYYYCCSLNLPASSWVRLFLISSLFISASNLRESFLIESISFEITVFSFSNAFLLFT